MTGVPPGLLLPNDYVLLRLALVDEVGFDAALLLERIRWRCEVREDGWVATYGELGTDTRLSHRRVKAAVSILRDRGWITSDNAGEGTRTLRWNVVICPSGRNDPMGYPSGRNDPTIVPERPDAPSIEDLENNYPPADAGEDPMEPHDPPDAPTLFAVPDPPQIREENVKPAGPPKNAGTLVARWCDGYRDANSGTDAPKAYMGRVAGQAKALAKACGEDHDEWVGAYAASYAAGQAGQYDMTRFLVTRPKASSNVRRNHFADHLGGQGSAFLAAVSGQSPIDPPRQIGPAS